MCVVFVCLAREKKLSDMENSRVVVLVSVVVILGWLSLEVLGGPVRHRVGGSKGWTQDVNYTEWSSHEHVFVGDWLCKCKPPPFCFFFNTYSMLGKRALRLICVLAEIEYGY